MLLSTATLKERFADWKDWDAAAYDLGVCLGFWRDFGAPAGEDIWHGVKDIIRSPNALGKALYNFLDSLVETGMLEQQTPNDNKAAIFRYRWNPNYKGLEI